MKNFSFLFIFCLSHTWLWAEKSNFANQTIDIGIVVKDINKSVQFYKKVVGFEEKEGFQVGGNFPKLVGLTDGTDSKIHVLRLGDKETA